MAFPEVIEWKSGAGGYSGLPVDSKAECVKAAGFDHVLCAAWHIGDNSGPHNVEEVRFWQHPVPKARIFLVLKLGRSLSKGISTSY